jgi:hypothetical protein
MPSLKAAAPRAAPAPPAPARALAGARPRPRARTAPAPARAFAGAPPGERPRERVLRYPNGLERRIRYPDPPEGAAASAAAASSSGSSGALATLDAPSCDPVCDAFFDFSEGAASDFGENEAWDALAGWRGGQAVEANDRGAESDAGGAAPAGAAAPEAARPAPANAPAEAPADAPARRGAGSFDSPLELLRYYTSDAQQAAARREWEETCASYDILAGCPWPAPRSLFVLAALAAAEGAAARTHTLRARLPREELEDELTRVLGGRRRPDGSPLIRCGALVDGIVAFEDAEAAKVYGAALEAASGARHAVAAVDSFELFRGAADARGAVVLMRRGAAAPAPHRLAAALRGQSALEEGGL